MLDALFRGARDGGRRDPAPERTHPGGCGVPAEAEAVPAEAEAVPAEAEAAPAEAEAAPPTLDSLFQMARDGLTGSTPNESREPDRPDPGAEPLIVERRPDAQPAQPPPLTVAATPAWRRLARVATAAWRWLAGVAVPRWRWLVSAPVSAWRWLAAVVASARRRLRRRGRQLGAFLLRRWMITLAAVVLAGTASGLAIALPRSAVTPAPAAGPPARAAPAAGDTGALSTAATAARDAATWVAQQVSRDAVVACDPNMCRALQASGFPVANLHSLRSGVADPLTSDVIVATAAVRDRLGSRLWLVDARTAIARFGSGAARIDILAVAPDGASAYQAALSADQAARRRAGAELLRNARIRATQAAARELAAGQVDSRLLIMFAALATSHPVNVVALTGPAPGADPGVPIRVMGISAPGSPAQSAAELRTIRSFMLAQRAPYLPTRIGLVRLADGSAVVRVEFGAPSPLSLLGTPAA